MDWSDVGPELFTVTNAVASPVPPAPVAVKWKVVVTDGVICMEPVAATTPMPPSMETLVAFVVCHVNVAVCPALIVAGSIVKEAVGAGVVPPPPVPPPVGGSG